MGNIFKTLINIVIVGIREIYNKSKTLSMRLRLKNKDFSILAPTCIGGVISHRLGLKFLSPTINLYMS